MRVNACYALPAIVNRAYCRYANLESFARKHWPVDEVVARWSAMDYVSSASIVQRVVVSLWGNGELPIAAYRARRLRHTV